MVEEFIEVFDFILLNIEEGEPVWVVHMNCDCCATSYKLGNSNLYNLLVECNIYILFYYVKLLS